MLPDLRSMTYQEMEAFILDLGEKKFRARQLFEWVHKKGVLAIGDMTNLSKGLREKLMSVSCLSPVKAIRCLTSDKDGTRKYLFQLADGQKIETVLMRYDHGNSVCISTQAGCRMGCTFCASGLLGLERNLTVGEMLGQIYYIEQDIGQRVSHTVLMGTGEPLDNFDNVTTFIDLFSDEKGKDVSQRHITLSTCGLVPEIGRLAEKHYQITLAVSLHASEDAVRKQTMPIARTYSIEQVMTACEGYFEQTGRRITFEYALIEGMNDSLEEAVKLAELLKKRHFKCHVNLIPVNSIDENKFTQTGKAAVRAFQKTLTERRIKATIRRALGDEINAACGQLRLNESQTAPEKTD